MAKRGPMLEQVADSDGVSDETTSMGLQDACQEPALPDALDLGNVLIDSKSAPPLNPRHDCPLECRKASPTHPEEPPHQVRVTFGADIMSEPASAAVSSPSVLLAVLKGLCCYGSFVLCWLVQLSLHLYICRFCLLQALWQRWAPMSLPCTPQRHTLDIAHGFRWS